MDTSWYLPPMLLSLTASHVLIVAELVSAHQTPQPVLHVSQDISWLPATPVLPALTDVFHAPVKLLPLNVRHAQPTIFSSKVMLVVLSLQFNRLTPAVNCAHHALKHQKMYMYVMSVPLELYWRELHVSAVPKTVPNVHLLNSVFVQVVSLDTTWFQHLNCVWHVLKKTVFPALN